MRLWLILWNMIFPLFLSGCVASNLPFDKEQAAQARVELALGYLTQRQFSHAKINLDKALSYAPNYYLVHSARAYFYQLQGDLEQAKSAYLHAIKLAPEQGDLYNNYAVFLCAQAEFDEAYHYFKQALQTTNYYNQVDSYENIALCARAEKNLSRYLAYKKNAG